MSYQFQRIPQVPSFQEKQINNYTYQPQNFLGKGSYSSVYRGQDNEQNIPVAIKIIENKLLRDEYIHNLITQECKIMQSLTHPNVVKLYEVLSTVNHLYIIQEFCNQSDLKALLEQKRVFTEAEALEVMEQILEGFKELLKNGIIHRDIKPANILINDNVFKIADFGFAIHVDGLDDNLKSSLVGTPLYMSPQCLKGEHYSSKNDIWSLGIILYELIYGDVPWPVNSKFELIQAFKTIPLKFHSNRRISPVMRDFIERCLKIEEYERIDWEQIYRHPLFKGERIEKGMTFTRNNNNKLIGVEYEEENNEVIEVNPLNERNEMNEMNENNEKNEINEENEEMIIEKPEENNQNFNILYNFLTFLENISMLNQKISQSTNAISQENIIVFDSLLVRYACNFIEKIILNENENCSFLNELKKSSDWIKFLTHMEKKHQNYINYLRKISQNRQNHDNYDLNSDKVLFEKIVKNVKDLIREGNFLLYKQSIECGSKNTRIDDCLFQYLNFLIAFLQIIKEYQENIEKLLHPLQKFSFPEIKTGLIVKFDDIKKLREAIYQLN